MINITNTVNNNTIIVCNDKINIYSLYFSINKHIEDIKKELKKLIKKLDLKKGGPPPVTAIDYEKAGASGTSKSMDVNDIYREIKEIVDKINDFKSQLRNLLKAKDELIDTFYQVAKLRKDNLELKVFIGYYIEKKSLKELSYELTKIDNLGRKQHYSYQYLRLIHLKIKQNLA